MHVHPSSWVMLNYSGSASRPHLVKSKGLYSKFQSPCGFLKLFGLLFSECSVLRYERRLPLGSGKFGQLDRFYLLHRIEGVCDRSKLYRERPERSVISSDSVF